MPIKNAELHVRTLKLLEENIGKRLSKEAHVVPMKVHVETSKVPVKI